MEQIAYYPQALDNNHTEYPPVKHDHITSPGVYTHMATAPAPTVWSVVRDILTANITLTADEVIAKARTQGRKEPDAVIRGTVHTVRKKLKQKAARPAATAPAAKPAPTPAPARKVAPSPKPVVAAKPAPNPKPATVAARKTTAPTVSSVVRAVLSADLEMPADEVILKAKARGVTAPDANVRNLVHNIRSELRRAAAKAPRVVASAARETAAAAPAHTSVAPATPAPAGLTQVLSNVSQVNTAVAAAGGVDAARQVAEAVRACGGPDAFSQYLDLVAGIRTDGPAAK